MLLTQCIGLLAIGLWTAVTMTIVFYVIKKTVGLRVSEQEEIAGLDKLEHGLESAYAGFVLKQNLFLGKIHRNQSLRMCRMKKRRWKMRSW